MGNRSIFRGQVISPDRIEKGTLIVEAGRILEIQNGLGEVPADVPVIDAGDGYLAPGFIDLHVHGGAGSDFMDGTAEAFRTALRCHARHGTTRMAITTTVATQDRKSVV